MDKLLHSIDVFLTPLYLSVSFVDTLLNASEKIVELMLSEMGTNPLAGAVVQRGADMKWKQAPGMQIPAAIWVTCPKGIIIPHMLSHAAGHRTRGTAALAWALSSSTPLSSL